MSTTQADVAQPKLQQLIDEAIAKVTATEKALTIASNERQNKASILIAAARGTAAEREIAANARVAYDTDIAAYRVAFNANCDAMDHYESLKYANSATEVAKVE